MIDLRGLGIVGHPATIDDELVRDLVFPWNENRGLETIGLAGEAKRGRPLVESAGDYNLIGISVWPSENDLMKVLVLWCRHDGEIELARAE